MKIFLLVISANIILKINNLKNETKLAVNIAYITEKIK